MNLIDSILSYQFPTITHTYLAILCIIVFIETIHQIPRWGIGYSLHLVSSETLSYSKVAKTDISVLNICTTESLNSSGNGSRSTATFENTMVVSCFWVTLSRFTPEEHDTNSNINKTIIEGCFIELNYYVIRQTTPFIS